MHKYNDLQVCKATLSDLPQIAKIHKESFSKDHTLPYFSLRIIERYYLEFIDRPNVIFLVCKKNNELVGFILGGEGDVLLKAKRNFIKYNRQELILECIKKIYNVPFMKKIFSTFFNIIKAKLNEANPSVDESNLDINFRMLSLAVNKDCTRKGIGSHLVYSFERQLQQSGIFKYGLSARKENISAINFYSMMGFEVHKETDTALYFYKEI